jgi:hypothetical protein
MKNLTLLFGVTAAMMCAACASEETIIERDVNVADLVPIKVAARAVNIDSSTRTPWIGDHTAISTTTPFDAYVLVSETDGNYTTLYVDPLQAHAHRIIWKDDIATTFSDEDGTETAYHYPIDKRVYLVGLYPHTKATTGGGWAQATAGTVSATTTAKGTYDGKTDLMVAPQKYADQDNSTTLEFAHLGTRLDLYLYADDAAEALVEWGNITEITLTGMAGGIKNTTVVTLSNGTATAGTATVTSLPFYKASATTYTNNEYTAQTYALTASAALQAYAIVPPVTTDAAEGVAEYTLTVKYFVNSTEKTKVVPLQLETAQKVSTKGKAYKVSLKFKEAGQVDDTHVAITEWNVGPATTQDVAG